MAIIKKRPSTFSRFWAVEPFAREIEHIFQEVFGRSSVKEGKPYEMSWAPPIEVAEKKDKYIVRAELPGVGKEDIKISLKENTLIIQGERKVEEEHKDATFYCCEVNYGSFYREIELPFPVKEDRVDAEFKNGILTINLPKEEKPKGKTIPIKVK